MAFNLFPSRIKNTASHLWAGGGDGELEWVGPHAPDDGRAVHVPVGYLAGEELPDTDPEGPDVHLLVAGLVPDHLRGHPGHSACTQIKMMWKIPILLKCKVKIFKQA